jgi:hypothetical protein
LNDIVSINFLRAGGSVISERKTPAWPLRNGKLVAIKPHYFNVPKPR